MAKSKKQPGLEKTATLIEVMEMISKGCTRLDVIHNLEECGITYSNAHMLYYDALKAMTPDVNLLDDYKIGIMQQNLDRLEKIIKSSIDGNTGDKKVALGAIDTLNKMLGLYNGNSVTINKNNQGDEQIQISFDK